MKQRIHFHSDCSFFAGCENMLVNFFNSDTLMSAYDVSFGYRFTERYEAGFRGRVQRQLRTMALSLLDIHTILELVDRVRFRPLKLFLKLILLVLPLKYLYVLINTARLYRLFRQERIDLLHINNGGYPAAYSCMAAVFAAKLAGVKRIVYVVNNMAASYRSPLRWLDYPLDRIVVKTVTHFITGSAYAGIQLREVLKLPPGKLLRIHNGIHPRSVTESREEVLQRLSLPADRLLIGIVALMEERKGHIYLLQSLKYLKTSGRLAQIPLLLIEGGGPLRPALERYVLEAGLTDDVRFVGHESKVFNFLGSLDALVLPSISNEDFPNVTLEGMSLGKTVIASRLAGIPEQIEHMESGLLVEPKDVVGLAEAIVTVVESESLRHRLGQNARTRFETKFKATVALQSYTTLYQRMLKEELA